MISCNNVFFVFIYMVVKDCWRVMHMLTHIYIYIGNLSKYTWKTQLVLNHASDWTFQLRNDRKLPSIWSNYSDLTRPHPKWWFSKGNLLISGKSRLVKYYNLARSIHLFIVGSYRKPFNAGMFHGLT